MAVKEHDPAEGGVRTSRHWLQGATLVGALLLGVAAGLAMRDEPPPAVSRQEEPTTIFQRSDADARASAWVDATFKKLRTDRAAADQDIPRPATMAEFLANGRADSEKWWRQRNEDLDQIVTQARAMRDLNDPVAALRDVRRSRDGYLKELVIIQYWLEKDSEAALAEIGRNWQLLDLEYLPALLERKFGIDWMNAAIADATTPYRLRNALVRELGRQMAHGKGLDGLLTFYNSISDPRMKILMAWEFSHEWPLDDPKTVARFLKGNVPVELRELLIEHWKQLPFQDDSWEEVWVRDFLEQLGMDGSDYVAPVGWYHGMNILESIKLQEARQSMTLDEVVNDCVKQGSSQGDAVGEAIRIKLHDAFGDGPDMIERFGEGQLTREELLTAIFQKIPGSDAHPDALEREVWRRSAWAAEPEEVSQWAAELARRGDIDELLTGAFTSSNIYGDPRIPHRLIRYRIVTQGLTDGRPLQLILHQAAYEWTRWQTVSPQAAEAWLKKLPSNEPMHQVIRARAALERQRKENP
jgi:hypothetical protein